MQPAVAGVSRSGSSSSELRMMSPLEQGLWRVTQEVPFNVVGVAELSGTVTEQQLREGWAALAARHALLRARVVGPLRLRYEEGEGLPLVLRRLPRRDERSWQAEAEALMDEDFGAGDGSLVRASWLEGEGRHTLILCIHHAIVDGRTLVTRLQEWVQSVQQLQLGEQPTRERVPTPPALDQRRFPLGEERQQLEHLMRYVVRSPATRLLRRVHSLALEPEENPRLRRSRLVHHRLTREDTQALRQRARAEETTLQGALLASVLLAAREEHDEPGPLMLAGYSAVSLREQLEPSPGDAMGIFVSQVTTWHAVRPRQAFWSLAREVREQLQQRLSEGEAYFTFPLTGYLVPPVPLGGRLFLRFFSRLNPVNLGVSNLGVVAPLELHRRAPLQLEQVHACVSLSLIGGFGLLASTFDEQLSLNFLYQTPVVSEKRAIALAARAQQLLREGLGASC